MKKAYIRTFGCQMNVHDSEKMAGILRDAGYELTGDRKYADIIIFNTCSIRQKAEQKFFSELGKVRSLKKARPDLRVAVAGCVARQMGEEIIKRAPHVDCLVGPQNLHAIGEMVESGSGVALEDNAHLAEMELPILRCDKVKAWVSIMFGCDNFCSYCVVPYTRGREKSRPSADIIKEIKGLSESGYKEVTLLGQNVNSYRSDADFPGLLRKLNEIKGIERIRFVTSHPRDLSEGLVEAISKLDKVCEHLHLPLQSGSDRILRAMNRGYTYDEYKRKIMNIRQKVPDISITSDIIAGFPSEDGNDHMDSIKALEELRFDGIFAFKFSPRPGTSAYEMEGRVDDATGLNRLKEILSLQDEITLEKNIALVGTVQDVLVEGISEKDPSRLSGRTRTNKIVNFATGDVTIGNIIKKIIIRAGRHSLEGEVLG